MSSTAVTDPRALRSRAALLSAATALLEAGRSDATVTDVVTRAGTSRPTFYQHFGDLPTLQRAAAHERLEEAFAPIIVPTGADAASPDSIHSALTGLLTRLLPHRAFYAAVLDGPAAVAVLEDTVEFVTERILRVSPLASTALSPSQGRFLAAGAIWLIRDWLFQPDPESADVTSARIAALLATVAGAGTH